MRKLFVNILVLSILFAVKLHGQEAVVIKVARMYGIINKGANQGVQEGLVYYVKRESVSGLIDVGKVKVIRVTANRGAVEQISNTRVPFLKIGDKLFPDEGVKPLTSQNNRRNKNTANATVPRQTKERKSRKTITKKPTRKEIPFTERKDDYHKESRLMSPWVSLNLGAGVPAGNLIAGYSPSFRIGGNYMVPASRNLFVGLEINHTWLNSSSSLDDPNLTGISKASASILEGLLVFQSFIGNYFFIEFGGGIFRPKLRTTSIDGIESTFSSTHFGVFGGTGFLVPTSRYAGFILKGRFHNYFDSNSRQYYGITGGFRFKIR